MPFKVYECSYYLDKNRPTWRQMTDLAIDILPLSSAKPAGFRTQAGSDVADEEEETEAATVNH